jgi:hypothetical protein
MWEPDVSSRNVELYTQNLQSFARNSWCNMEAVSDVLNHWSGRGSRTNKHGETFNPFPISSISYGRKGDSWWVATEKDQKLKTS